MPKPAYATEEDLASHRSEIDQSVFKAKEAGEKAAKDVRSEILNELGKVSRVVTDNAEVSKAAMQRVAEDAATHAKSVMGEMKKEVMTFVNMLQERLSSTESNLMNSMNDLDSGLKQMFANELMELGGQFDKELSNTKAEVYGGMEKWGKEAAEAMVQQRREIDGLLGNFKQELADFDTNLRMALGDESKRVLGEMEKANQKQDDRSERSQNEIWLKLERLDDLVKETRDGAKEHTDEVDTRCTKGINDLRHDAETRLNHLDVQAAKLHDGVAEVENIPTRRVDWVIRDVSQRLRPPDPAKACLHTSWFSPKFDMAGAHGLQLELQLFRRADPPIEGEAAGDCAAYLWACKGMNLVYKLYIGTKSAQMDKVFNGRVPFGTKRLCFLKDQINREEDSLRVSLEIMEAVREVEHPIKPAPPIPDDPTMTAEDREEAERARPLDGKIVFRRHVNNRLTDQVRDQVETMRSRMVRRVEWRLENASCLRRCFPPGEPMCSVAFAAAGVEGLQLMFYPSGYTSATDGFCSLFLYASAGATLKFSLFAGTHRRDATNFFEDAGAFGRTNYCRFDSIVEQESDTILIALEIEEAHQDVTAKIAHPIVAPGDRRTQSQIDGAVPKSVESVVKMQRVPGKLAGALEDKRVLPSLWTAKSLSEKSSPNDVRGFDELKIAARTSSSAQGKRTQPSSPIASSPLNASRSMPSLSKELSTVDLAQVSKTSGDWSTGIGPKKVRVPSGKKGMASTMQVLQSTPA